MPDTIQSAGIAAEKENESVALDVRASIGNLSLRPAGMHQRRSTVVTAYMRKTDIFLKNAGDVPQAMNNPPPSAVDPVMALLNRWKKKNLFPKAPQRILAYENEINTLGSESANVHLLPLNQSRFTVCNCYLKTVKTILNHVVVILSK